MKNAILDKSLLKLFAIFLFAISLIFLSNYYIYKTSMEAMYEQAETNNHLVVSSVIQSFEEVFKEINDIIYTVSTLPYNVYDTTGHNNIDINNAYLLLKNVNQIISQDYIQDFILYFKDSDLVLTLDGTASFRSIFNKKYKNNQYAPEYWKNYAVTRHSYKIIPPSTYEDTWTSSKYTRDLMAIVPSNLINQKMGSIVVFVDMDKLYQKVNKGTMMENSSLIILDKENNIILSTDENYDIEGMESIFFTSKSNGTILNGDFNYHYERSDYNGFTYINKIPRSFENYLSTISLNKFILIATTIFGIIICFMLSIYIYRPIKRLIWLVGDKSLDNSQDNYEYLYQSIEKIQLENKMISNKMDNVRQDVMRSIFFKMIDDFTFYKDMKDQIDIYFKAIFYNRHFLMVGFDLSNNQSIDANTSLSLTTMSDMIRLDIEGKLEQICGGDCSIAVFYMENMQLIALVGVSEKVKRSKLMDEIEEVKNRLQQDKLKDYNLLVAVGKLYTDPQNCKEAFEDIKLSFAYRTIKNKKTVIDLEKNEYSYDIYLPLSFDEKLSNYMLSGNKEESILLIDEVIRTNISNNISKIKLKYVIENIFHTIIIVLNRLNTSKEELLTIDKAFHTLNKNMYNEDQMHEYFSYVVELATNKIQVESQSKLNKDLLLQYIQVNYAQNLYLDKMAEEFNTTPKYFSNFFKKAFGINFVEYLNKVRINHAKELLKNSDLNVNDISDRVGYLNPSTFTSTFKKYTGITPSEYRKNGNISDEKISKVTENSTSM